MADSDKRLASSLLDVQSVLSCKVCFTPFSNTPFCEAYTLPCSHTLCHHCLDKLFDDKSSERRVCPFDRKPLPKSIVYCARTRCLEEATDAWIALCHDLSVLAKCTSGPVLQSLQVILPEGVHSVHSESPVETSSQSPRQCVQVEHDEPEAVPSAPAQFEVESAEGWQTSSTAATVHEQSVLRDNTVEVRSHHENLPVITTNVDDIHHRETSAPSPSVPVAAGMPRRRRVLDNAIRQASIRNPCGWSSSHVLQSRSVGDLRRPDMREASTSGSTVGSQAEFTRRSIAQHPSSNPR